MEALAEEFARAGGTVTQMIENARSAAKSLSPDPLQGIAEIVQNANDVGASNVRFVLSRSELTVFHDGRPVNLRDLHSLAAPWLTTKRDDSRATGRFGIGLATLHTISDYFDLHSADYHVRLGDPTLESVEPADLGSVNGALNETVMRVPLSNHRITADELFDWCDRWDDTSLLFLESVREIQFVAGQRQTLLKLEWLEEVSYAATIAGDDVGVVRRTARSRHGQVWDVHRAEVSSPAGLKRAHKKTDKVTPIAVALAGDESPVTEGEIHAGLPLVRSSYPLRANGQFDPVTSRQGLTGTEWNLALAEKVVDLWNAAMLQTFATNPRIAWGNVPLGDDDDSISDPLLRHLRDLLSERVPRCAGNVKLAVESDMVPLPDMAYETSSLAGLLTPEETADLAGRSETVPESARDANGVWRQVIDDWRSKDVPSPTEVSVDMALVLIDQPERGLGSVINIAAAALGADLENRLLETQFVRDVDGNQHAPSDTLPILIDESGGLAETLGIGTVIDPAFLADTDQAVLVRKWLESSGILTFAKDNSQILRRLASTGERDTTFEQHPLALSDGQLQVLREALEALGKDTWEELGPGIGQTITFQCFQFTGRNRKASTYARPCDAYGTAVGLPDRSDS